MAEEVTLREKRKADHEMAHYILYAEDFPAIQALCLHLNLPRASDPNMDMSSELEFMIRSGGKPTWIASSTLTSTL